MLAFFMSYYRPKNSLFRNRSDAPAIITVCPARFSTFIVEMKAET